MSDEKEPGRVENEINEILARTTSGAGATPAPQGARDPLDRELRQIKEIIVRMGSLTEAAIRDALTALTTHDAALAEKIIVNDRNINAMQHEVISVITTTIATQSPVARDLRNLLTMNHVAYELERIADMAKGISKRVIRLVDSGNYRYPSSLVQMAEAALNMLRDVLIAFSNEDIRLCLEVRRADAYVDNLNREVVAWAREWIEQDVEKSGAAIELLAIAQRVERLADIVTAIAEDTVFLVEGRLVRHGLE